MHRIAALVEGYRRFQAGTYASQKVRFDELSTEGQSPTIMVIACSDSRVDPALIFDTNPGEVFVVRNVAALVPPFETTPGRHGVSAALEFAVQVLGVRAVVVMGHGQCGGCNAALRGDLANAAPGEGGFLAGWIDMLEPARERVLASHGYEMTPAAGRAMEQEAVRVSIANLLTFPWVREKAEAGTLLLAGAFFAISDGRLQLMNRETGIFEPVDLERS
jgi:carbonic anhydrase